MNFSKEEIEAALKSLRNDYEISRRCWLKCTNAEVRDRHADNAKAELQRIRELEEMLEEYDKMLSENGIS